MFGGGDAVATPRPNGPGNLEDVATEHEQARTEGGRPPLPPSGDPKKDARREADRARYQRKTGSTRTARPVQATVLPALFTPETCRALVRLPFDVAGVALQSKSWTLDEDETEMVAGPCAETLNVWFPEADPKWAALTALSFAILTVASKKYIMFQEERRGQEESAV